MKKLLLTSAGVRNHTIKSTLTEMLGQPTSESVISYIPTASLGDLSPHGWFVDEIKKVYDLGWKEFQILSLNDLPKTLIEERLDKTDLIYAEGGNLYHLANSIIDQNLIQTLEDFFNHKMYLGVSAGSMIFSKNVSPHSAELFNEHTHLDADKAKSPFNFFDWYVKPHLHSKDFPERTDSWIKAIAAKASFPIYAIDDETAIKVVGDTVEVIGEGTWKLYEPKSK